MLVLGKHGRLDRWVAIIEVPDDWTGCVVRGRVHLASPLPPLARDQEPEFLSATEVLLAAIQERPGFEVVWLCCTTST